MKVVLKLRADGAGMPIFAQIRQNHAKTTSENLKIQLTEMSGKRFAFPDMFLFHTLRQQWDQSRVIIHGRNCSLQNRFSIRAPPI